MLGLPRIISLSIILISTKIYCQKYQVLIYFRSDFISMVFSCFCCCHSSCKSIFVAPRKKYLGFSWFYKLNLCCPHHRVSVIPISELQSQLFHSLTYLIWNQRKNWKPIKKPYLSKKFVLSAWAVLKSIIKNIRYFCIWSQTLYFSIVFNCFCHCHSS